VNAQVVPCIGDDCVLGFAIVLPTKEQRDKMMGTRDAWAKSAPASSAPKKFQRSAHEWHVCIVAAPRPTPFPGPAAATEDTRPPGRAGCPRYEIAGMYDSLIFRLADPFANFVTTAHRARFTYNASKWLGLTAELAGYQFQTRPQPLTGSSSSVNGGFMTYLFGPG